uniref:Transposase n=1 Tax=Eptatretus burgeri TaxID=7764 RepID=A0A8C4Q2K6_EPTBU
MLHTLFKSLLVVELQTQWGCNQQLSCAAVLEPPSLHDDQRKQAIGMLKSGISQESCLSTSQQFLDFQTDIELQEWLVTVLVLVHSVTPARQYRSIAIGHLRNRFRTVRETARTTIGTRGRLISDRTVQCHLAARCLQSCQSYRGQILTHQHRLAFQRWAASGGRRWANVIFSDESRFNVSWPDGHLHVYCRQGHCFFSELHY